MKKSKILKFLTILSFSIVLINCGRTAKLTSKIIAVKTAPFEDLRIAASVTEFKAAGFRYGDLIEYSFTYKFDDEEIKEHRHIVPFVSNYLEAGLNQGCICDYEKAGIAISICLGFTKDYDELSMNDTKLIGTDIVFTIYRSDGWGDINNQLGVTGKNTYESVGRNKYVYVNMRDIKRVKDNIFNENIGSNVIYRSSAPFDNVYNKKRYSIADDCLGDVIDACDEGAVYFVSLNYEKNDSEENNNESTTPRTLKQFYDLRMEDETAPNFTYLWSRFNDNVFGYNVGDNFFSDKNREKIKELFKTLSGCAGYTVVINDTEGSIRTGFVIFMLEALLDGNYKVSLDTLISDYMLSFSNYYSIIQSDNNSKSDLIKDFTINRILYTLSCCSYNEKKKVYDYESAKGINWYTFKASDALKILNVEKNLSTWVKSYFINFLGLSNNEIDSLKDLVRGIPINKNNKN